MKGVEDVCK